jgi:hypothetical protein
MPEKRSESSTLFLSARSFQRKKKSRTEANFEGGIKRVSKKQKTDKGMAKKPTMRTSKKYQTTRSLREPFAMDLSPRGTPFSKRRAMPGNVTAQTQVLP